MTQQSSNADTDIESAEEQSSENDHDAQSSVEGTFAHAVEEGRERLSRSWSTLFATGLVGGVDLGFGVLALILVKHVTGSDLLGALAFTIGFIAIVLAQSELFTENFLIPVLAVVAHDGRWREVIRLWAGTLIANLIGGWVIMGIVAVGVPELARSDAILSLGEHFIDKGIGLDTFASAVLGGAAITLLTWMERTSREVLGKLAAAITMGFVLAAVPLLHSIVTSLEVFGALHAGAPFGYVDWLGIFGWSVLGNIVGGIGLVTVLRLIQAGGKTVRGPDLEEDDVGARGAEHG